MKTMKINNILKVSIILIFLSLGACTDSKPKQAKSADTETMDSGTLKVYCEQSAYSLLDTTFVLYEKASPNVKFSVETGNSRELMKKLMAGEARAIIISRDYLKDEDSLMKAFKVDKHYTFDIAQDALCFYSNVDFPLDTMNADDLFKILTKKKTNISKYYPVLGEDYTFVTNSFASSEYANIKKLVARGQTIEYPVKLMGSSDSVISLVQNTKKYIGIGYLGQIARNPNLKKISIGYTDTAGYHVRPKPVHQAYIVQGLYPYVITYKVLLIEDRKNLPFWFGAYISKESIVQKYLKEAGVVPSYAKFVLIKED